MLEVEAFDNKAIRKLTLIKSPEQKPHQRGTIRKRLPSEDGTASAKSLDSNTRPRETEARQARRMTGQRGNKVAAQGRLEDARGVGGGSGGGVASPTLPLLLCRA